jgi:hypothetical protein
MTYAQAYQNTTAKIKPGAGILLLIIFGNRHDIEMKWYLQIEVDARL